MEELTVNLHMHTTYSDGSGSHAELGKIALKSEVDVLLVTDHNVLVQGLDSYYDNGLRKVLLLVCEEIHDQDRDPQKNHLLAFGVDRELSSLADDPQILINAVNTSGGISFIAHPNDVALPAFNETDITWVNWDATGYTGIELWNGFSELKSIAHGKWAAIVYAFFPKFIPHGPAQETLARWDDLTSLGTRVVGIGGSDAHAQHLSLGPIHKIIFPYEYHFSIINTHVLVASPLSDDLIHDRKMVFDAFRNGHCFIGNDLPGSTQGFRYTAKLGNTEAIMGDEIVMSGSLTLEAILPSKARVRLLKDGKVIQEVIDKQLCYVVDDPGIYRIEAYKYYLGKLRGWIFSNPIYIR
jgi:hypothetical protein